MSTSSSDRHAGNARLLSSADLAAYLSISRTSVYRMIDRRIIPFHRVSGVIRFRLADVDKYLAGNRVGEVDLEHL